MTSGSQIPFFPTLQKRFEAYQKAQDEITKLRNENKVLYQKLTKYKTDYFNRLSKIIRKGDFLISQQIKELITQFDEEDKQFYDAAQRYNIVNKGLQQAQGNFSTHLEQIQALEQKLITQRSELKKRLAEIANLDGEAKIRQEQKIKLENQIKSKKEVELNPKTKEIKRLKDEINQLLNNITQRKDEITQADKAILGFNRQINDQCQEIDSMKQHFIEQENHLTKIYDETTHVENQVKTKQEEEKTIRTKLKNLIENELHPLQNNLKGINEKCNQKQIKITNYRNDLKKLIVAISAENDLYQEQVKTLRKMEQDITDTKTQQQQHQKDIDGLDNQIKDRFAEREKVQHKIEELRTREIPDQETQLKQKQAETATLQAEISLKENHLKKLEQDITPINQHLEKLSKKSQHLESQLRKQKHTSSQLNKNKELLDSRIQAHAIDRKNIEEKINYLSETELTQKENLLKDTNRQIVQAQTKFKNQKITSENLTKKTRVRNEELNSLQNMEETLKREHVLSEQKLKTLHETLSTIENEVNREKSQIQKQDQVISQLKTSIAEYPKLSERAKTSRKLLEFEIPEHKRELLGFKKKVQNQKKNIRDLKKQRKALQPVSPLIQAWKNLLLVCGILLILGLLGFTLWYGILKDVLSK
ncbi:hypothetical protein ACFL5I_00785 [Planctomycetota bacterium]